ncbi:MAG: 4Fe-4S binding protein, partial [Deltaproteobacteria bacterium]|nr:4Fe-4S binding protein [Deltaproteobacteria bacterium]
MIRFQRLTQTATFLLFVTLLYAAAHPVYEGLQVDFLLRLDPLIAVGTGLAERDLGLLLLPGLLILAGTALLGRFFCGHICP